METELPEEKEPSNRFTTNNLIYPILDLRNVSDYLQYMRGDKSLTRKDRQIIISAHKLIAQAKTIIVGLYEKKKTDKLINL